MRIKIPLTAESQQNILCGHKICTSRYYRLGYPGDTFEVLSSTFRIYKVERVPLGIAAASYYRQEGFNSASEFLSAWWKLHPQRFRNTRSLVYVHWFSKVVNGKE